MKKNKSEKEAIVFAKLIEVIKSSTCRTVKAKLIEMPPQKPIVVKAKLIEMPPQKPIVVNVRLTPNCGK